MTKTLAFNSNQILSKEELRAWDESLRELLGHLLFYVSHHADAGGILDVAIGSEPPYTLLRDVLAVSVGSVPSGGYNTIKISAGTGIFNIQNLSLELALGLNIDYTALRSQLFSLFKWETQDNIVVSGIAGYQNGDIIYVGFRPVLNPLEEGLCSISASNQVTTIGGNFLHLRGQSTKNPTKVRFFHEDGSAASNSEIYEVISVIDATQLTISGSVTVESGVKMLVVGSYDLRYQGALDTKASYAKATGLLTFTDDENLLPNAGGFNLALLRFGTGGTFTLEDLRLDNLYTWGLDPDIVYQSNVSRITGEKTFAVSNHVIDVPLIIQCNHDSFDTPIVPVNDVLTIPSRYIQGHVIKIKATPATGESDIDTLVITDGVADGLTLKLYLDPTGEDMTINSGLAVNKIHIAGVSGDQIIPKGTVLDLWCDDKRYWHLVNVVVL